MIIWRVRVGVSMINIAIRQDIPILWSMINAEQFFAGEALGRVGSLSQDIVYGGHPLELKRCAGNCGLATNQEEDISEVTLTFAFERKEAFLKPGDPREVRGRFSFNWPTTSYCCARGLYGKFTALAKSSARSSGHYYVQFLQGSAQQKRSARPLPAPHRSY